MSNQQANYMHVYDDAKLRNLKIQLQDYLFDKGHTINKPMIDDLAIFVYDLNEASYAQGQMKGVTITGSKPHGEQPLQVNSKSHNYTEPNS